VGVGLSLTVLGCCGSFPGAGGACSGYLVRSDATTLWVDAGSGTMANLQHHVGLHDVDGVVLSHEHPDHWSDLEGFRVACAYVLGREGVPVYAPPGFLRLLYKDFKLAFDWHEVDDGSQVRIGDLDVRFSRTEHGPVTLGMRIDGGGRSLGYTSDTGPGWSLAALGGGLDLALSEATYTSQYEGVSLHLSGRQAGQAAREAGVGRLLLTHFWPTLRVEDIQQEAASAFGAPVEIAVQNEEYFI
jgi:ribonuclease BN (tRNA processing enzyme)